MDWFRLFRRVSGVQVNMHILFNRRDSTQKGDLVKTGNRYCVKKCFFLYLFSESVGNQLYRSVKYETNLHRLGFHYSVWYLISF